MEAGENQLARIDRDRLRIKEVSAEKKFGDGISGTVGQDIVNKLIWKGATVQLTPKITVLRTVVQKIEFRFETIYRAAKGENKLTARNSSEISGRKISPEFECMMVRSEFQ